MAGALVPLYSLPERGKDNFLVGQTLPRPNLLLRVLQARWFNHNAVAGCCPLAQSPCGCGRSRGAAPSWDPEPERGGRRVAKTRNGKVQSPNGQPTLPWREIWIVLRYANEVVSSGNQVGSGVLEDHLAQVFVHAPMWALSQSRFRRRNGLVHGSFERTIGDRSRFFFDLRFPIARSGPIGSGLFRNQWPGRRGPFRRHWVSSPI